MVKKGSDTLFQILAHHPLHRIAVETNELLQNLVGQQSSMPLRLLLCDNLQQNVTGQILTCLGVLNLKSFTA